MELVFDERSANSSFVEMIWHTHSERAGTFTSVAVSNWEMVITTFDGKTMITARGPETKASEADFPPTLSSAASPLNLARSCLIYL